MISLEETKNDALLRLLPATLPRQESEKLPSFITAADLRELMHYLRRRPAGVMVAEELDRPRKRLFEDRKVDAYGLLGITARHGQTLKLTTWGWKLALKLEQDAHVFRSLLERHDSYVNALQWISLQNIDMITSTELNTFWHGLNAEGFPFADQEAFRSSAVSFFNLCQAAGLGTMTLGKRGHITRLFVDRDELERFLAGKSTLDSQVEPIADNHTASDSFTVIVKCDIPELADLLHRTLEMAGLPSLSLNSITEKGFGENATVPSADKCALITVLDEESFVRDNNENTSIRDRILIELGAAHVQYDQRVIILSRTKAARSNGLKDLIWYEIDGDRLEWETGLQLIKQLLEFREHIQAGPPVSANLAAVNARV